MDDSGLSAKGTWKADLQRALVALRSLPTGSDSWASHRPSDEMLALARQVIGHIHRDLPIPLIAAGTDGTIQIKWCKPGLETSIFVYPECTLEYLWRKNGKLGSGEISLNQIDDLFSEF